MTTFIEPLLSSIPPELRNLPRWVTWRAEGAPGEKPRKVPHDAKALSARASSTDPATWATFAEAETAYLERVGEPDAFTGLGIVLDGDGLVGVDIDHCVIDGKPEPAALALLDKLGAAYVELSPSGTGLRAFGYAEGLATGCKGKIDGLDVELYSTGRYLTMTGQTLKAGPITSLRGFGNLADSIRATRKVNPETGEIADSAPDERHAILVQRVLSGDVLHDSLRDLAASLVSTGMRPGAVVNHLRGLMDCSAAPHDARWQARSNQIPDLVSSAARKWEPPRDDDGGLHPLAKFVHLDGEPTVPRWLVPGFIADGVVVISGAHGVGKTTALLPLAMVTAGLHAEGDPLAPRHWRHVVYISEDVAQAGRITVGLVGHLGLDMAVVRERLHVVEARRLDAAYVATVGTTYRQGFARVVEGVELPPLVVLDTKSAVIASENENDNAEASRMMAALKQSFAGLPVWLIGHVSRANFGRTDVLASRGASAIEGDAHQTLFLISEADTRYLLRGKTRFEAEWPELEITSYLALTSAVDEFGQSQPLALRWGVAHPPAQSRKEAAKQAAEHQRRQDEAALRQEVLDAVETAWELGHPVNRSGVRAKVRRNGEGVVAAMENLLSERWLVEVAVPAKDRANNAKKAFLSRLSTHEHDALLAGGVIPAAKLAIPPSWRKETIPVVPEAAHETEEASHEQGRIPLVPIPLVP